MAFLILTLLLIGILAENSSLQAMHKKNSITENILRAFGKTSKGPYELIKECLDAIVNNDIKTVKKILKIKNFDVNWLNPEYTPTDSLSTTATRQRNFKAPLHLAAELGNVDIVKLLIKYGANINLPSHNTDYLFGSKFINDSVALSNGISLSPLAFAILSDTSNPEVIQELINAGADSNAHFIFNLTPLHLAATVLNIPALRILLKQPTINASVRTQVENQTALNLAQSTNGESFLWYSEKESLSEQELQNKKNEAIRLLAMQNTLKSRLLQYIRKSIDKYRQDLNILPIELREEILS